MRTAAIALIVSLQSVMLHAQTGDVGTGREVAPGVTYRQVVDRSGPRVIHLVRVDLRRPDIAIRHARALDQLRGREKTSEMARRAGSTGDRTLAAVNADFFWLTSGENENNQVIAGEWWKGVKVTDSPYDTFDNTHVQLAIDDAGRPSIDRFVFDGIALVRGNATPILSLNLNPSGKPEGTALFTSRFGATTPRDTTRVTAEVQLASAGRAGDTLLFVRQGSASSSSGSAIPVNGAVLSAYGNGSRLQEVQAMKEGDTVRVLLATTPRLARGVPSLVIGGWPRILRNGVNVAAEAPSAEGTISRNAEARHPRSAVGFSRDSTHLLIVTVDGRQSASVGATLVELADLMLTLGAWDAMNLDGGGSTTLVVDGAVVNKPSDPSGEREVGNALLVVKKGRY